MSKKETTTIKEETIEIPRNSKTENNLMKNHENRHKFSGNQNIIVQWNQVQGNIVE